MNVMFDDRQYLLVPDADILLVERLMIGNNNRKNPYDLSSIIDPRTLENHDNVLHDNIKVNSKNGWAFYFPTNDCPLNYRELSLWFVLWSIQPRHNERYFQQSFTGLERLVGLGARQASELASRLEERNLIKVFRTEGWPWFYLLDYGHTQEWFKPLASKTIPAEILEAERIRNLALKQPDVIMTKEKTIRDYIKDENRDYLERFDEWMNKYPMMAQHLDNWKADAIVKADWKGSVGSRIYYDCKKWVWEKEHEQHEQPKHEQPTDEPGEDDFIERLRKM